MDPVVLAAGATAGAGLLQALLGQQNAKAMYDRQRKDQLADAAVARQQALEDQKRNALDQAYQGQIAQAGQAGDRERSAIQNLINVFQRLGAR